jgi:hypothetical protein
MKKENKESLHWVVIGAISALIGLMVARVSYATFELHLFWSILVGAVTFTVCGLLMYDFKQVKKAFANAYKHACKVPSLISDLLDERRECKLKIQENRKTRVAIRYMLYRKKIFWTVRKAELWIVAWVLSLCSLSFIPLIINGTIFSLVILVPTVFTIECILLALATHIRDSESYRSRRLEIKRLFYIIPYQVLRNERGVLYSYRTFEGHNGLIHKKTHERFELYTWRFFRNRKIFAYEESESFENYFGQSVRFSAGTGCYNRIVDLTREDLEKLFSESGIHTARGQFDCICDLFVKREKERFLKWNPVSMICRGIYWLFTKDEDESRPICDIAKFIGVFFSKLFLGLNTHARRVIFCTSLIGFTTGVIAEWGFDSPATSPFWCLGSGFVFGVLQNGLYQLTKKRLQRFVESY